MAAEYRVFDLPGAVSTADMSALTDETMFVFVKADPATANNVIKCSNHADRPRDILQNNPKAGDAAQVRVLGLSKALLGATPPAVGGEIGTDANGACVAKNPTNTGADIGDYVMGECVETGLAGEVATVLLLSPYRI